MSAPRGPHRSAGRSAWRVLVRTLAGITAALVLAVVASGGAVLIVYLLSLLAQ